MFADLQFTTSSDTVIDVPAADLSEQWPRLSQELTGLSMAAHEPQLSPHTDDTPQDAGPKEQEREGSPEGPSPQAPSECPTCPKPDPAVLWMDRTAAALRVIKEAIVLTGVLLPWILGIQSSETALRLFAPPDSPTAG